METVGRSDDPWLAVSRVRLDSRLRGNDVSLWGRQDLSDSVCGGLRSVLASEEDAYALLASLGAPNRLILHLRLVGEAAEEVVTGLRDLGIEFDEALVRLGVAVHDAGKILHPEELTGGGRAHEPAGERLLLDNGVQPEVARCCLSHARYETMEVSFEELLVALSDKLWKGKRAEALELRVIDKVAELAAQDRGEVFGALDTCFEEIASKGDSRLARSIGS